MHLNGKVSPENSIYLNVKVNPGNLIYLSDEVSPSDLLYLNRNIVTKALSIYPGTRAFVQVAGSR